MKDGGFAFPCPASAVIVPSGQISGTTGTDGMSLRDYFAGQALLMMRVGDGNFPRE